MSQFIGRGEKKTKKIMEKLFPGSVIIPQYKFTLIITTAEFEFYDQEKLNHKFDFYVKPTGQWPFIIEVNYKHKEKAAINWDKIFCPVLRDHGITPVTIRDWDSLSLFNGKEKITYLDYWDVLNALKIAGVKP